MSMDKVMEKINDEALGTIAGGMSRNMKAAYDVYDGKYGNGAERKAKLEFTLTCTSALLTYGRLSVSSDWESIN